MRRLLLDLKTDGYPLDFLLARLRGRRRAWSTATGRHSRQPVDPWPALQSELHWLYKTMPRKTRREFAFCFLYFELQRLLTGLRLLAGRNREGMNRLVEQSLFDRDLLRQLQKVREVNDATRLLDTALSDENGSGLQLEQTLTDQGQRKMEERLIDAFFHEADSRNRRPALRRFFSQLVDLHNLLALLKSRRWQLPEDRPLLPGGTQTPEQWQALQRPGQELKLRRSIGRISGIEEFEPESVEHAMLGRIQRRLHRQARTQPDPYLVLDYLWSHYLHTRNLGLQRWAGDQLAAWEKLG